MIRIGHPWWSGTAAALLLLAAAAFVLVTSDTGTNLAADKPSVASVDDIELVDFDQRGSLLELTVQNVGASPTTIAQVQVNYAYWAFTMSPSQTLAPQGRATVTLDYPWDHSFQIYVRLVTSAGAIAEIGLSPELGEYRTPVKSWQVLTPRHMVALTLVALAPLVFVVMALTRADAGSLGPGRAAIFLAASAVIVAHILETVIHDPNASTMHGPLMRGTVGLLLVSAIGYAVTWACRGGVVWTMAMSVGMYAAATALAAADVAAVGQDNLIPQLVAQLGLILLVRAGLVMAASESRRTSSWLLASSAGLLIVAATLGASIAAPSLSPQTWAPVLRALAIGADVHLLTIVWRARLAGLRAPGDAFSGLGLLAAAVAVILWLTTRTAFY